MNVPKFSIIQGDALSRLREIPDGAVHLVITDPPYESLEKHRAIGTTTRLKHSKSSSNNWFSIFPNHRFPELLEQIYRVLAKNAHFYLHCDAETMFFVKPIAESIGFKFWKPLIWDKQKIGMGYHYRSRHEYILFFEKGKRKLTNLSVADVIECPRIWKGYPTEKPVRVSEILVTQSSKLGEVVLDPFCGSGSTGVAALTNGRHFLGIDLCSEALKVSRSRIERLGDEDEPIPIVSIMRDSNGR